jgi:hypothetical protein
MHYEKSYNRELSCFTVLVTATGWYRTIRPMYCDHFMMYCASQSEFYSFLIHPPELSDRH